jgi:hypothetical protein
VSRLYTTVFQRLTGAPFVSLKASG